jgi:hypothetical protein
MGQGGCELPRCREFFDLAKSLLLDADGALVLLERCDLAGAFYEEVAHLILPAAAAMATSTVRMSVAVPIGRSNTVIPPGCGRNCIQQVRQARLALMSKDGEWQFGLGGLRLQFMEEIGKCC